MDFTDPALLEALEAADEATLDEQSFGVVAMALDGTVLRYNVAESKLAGLSPARVLGKHFFREVAPCT
ncbi:MAG: photoactive yellow protein, partial [Minicystis sp.]